MTELSKVTLPAVQEVSVLEALQGGVRSPLRLDERKKGIAEAFVRAHEGQQAAFTAAPSARLAGVPVGRHVAPPPAVQVDAYEQALAVAARGGIRDAQKSKDKSPHVALYRARFTPDPNFLRKDLKIFKATLATRAKSLVDLATHLKPEEQALRRYLLLKMLEPDASLTKLERATASKLLNRCMTEHGDYINSAVAAFEVGSALKLDRSSLNEYIKAFHLVESKSSELIQPDNMLVLFRHLRRGTTEENLPNSLKSFKNELIDNLSREKTQKPNRASVIRQHLIISQIQQIRVIQKFLIVHQRFVGCCKKLNFDNLPNPLDLMEMGLRAMASGEIIGGISDLVRCASTVTARQRPAKNIFMTNYALGVLKNPEFSQLYRTRAHQLQVAEGIGKQMVAGAVLGAVRQHD